MAKRGKALFKSVCLGKCQSRDLPKRLNLTGIAPEMNRLWEASVREIDSGIVSEHAALLVWEHGRLHLTNIVEGADNEVEPNYQPAEGQRFVGTFHTHPYVRGLKGVAFSGDDFATTLTHRENLSIVHCGDKIAALVRTELTAEFVDTEAVDQKARELFQIYLRNFPFTTAIFRMNLVLCEKYCLGLYMGNITGKLHLEFNP